MFIGVIIYIQVQTYVFQYLCICFIVVEFLIIDIMYGIGNGWNILFNENLVFFNRL